MNRSPNAPPSLLALPSGQHSGNRCEIDGGQADSEKPNRQLDQAEGIIEPCDGTVAEMRCDLRVDDDIELRYRQTDDRRNHHRGDFPQAGIVRIDHRRVTVSFTMKRGDLYRKLSDPPDHRTAGKGQDGVKAESSHEWRKSQSDDDIDKIEDCRRQGGEKESAKRVESAHESSRQRNKKEKG